MSGAPCRESGGSHPWVEGYETDTESDSDTDSESSTASESDYKCFLAKLKTQALYVKPTTFTCARTRPKGGLAPSPSTYDRSHNQKLAEDEAKMLMRADRRSKFNQPARRKLSEKAIRFPSIPFPPVSTQSE